MAYHQRLANANNGDCTLEACKLENLQDSTARQCALCIAQPKQKYTAMQSHCNKSILSHLHGAVLGAIHARAARAAAARAGVGAAARAHHHKVLGRSKGAGGKATAGATRALLRGAHEWALHRRWKPLRVLLSCLTGLLRKCLT